MKVPDGIVRPSERVTVFRTLRLNDTETISHGTAKDGLSKLQGDRTRSHARESSSKLLTQKVMI